MGGSNIEVYPKYWRRTTNSTLILQCPNPGACLGGYSIENGHPVKCKTGYTGYLCIECDIVDGVKYQKVGNYECTKCPDPILNGVKVIGIALLIFIFLLVLVGIAIRKKRENQTSILLRILANYLQLLAVSTAFRVNYPSSFMEAMNSAESLGSVSETFLSFECFIRNSHVTGFAPSTIVFKSFLTALLPIICFLL